MNTPKKLILDYSKWICGFEALEYCPHQLGKGNVRLLNDEGFSCCIGQWSLQCGFKKNEIIERGGPDSLRRIFPLFNHKRDEWFADTVLAQDCITINDDIKTTPELKIRLLTSRLAKEGITLEVINKPA